MKPTCKDHRFPPAIISYPVWLYHRFTLSFRDVEDLLPERGVIVSYESIRYWCRKLGPEYARKLRMKQGRLGDFWRVDEIIVTIQGQRFYLWRAVDQDGDVIAILVTLRRGQAPWQLMTDELARYKAVHLELFPSGWYRTRQ